MEPKPLFPSKVTTIAQARTTTNNGPEPLFPSPAKQTIADGPKPLFPLQPKNSAVMTNAEFKAMHVADQKQQDMLKREIQTKHVIPGKLLFPNQAVSASSVDPFYKSHPLCKELSNKDIGRVKGLVQTAAVQDAEYVLHYGDEQRERFTKLIDEILTEQTSGKTAEVNRKINTLLSIMDESDRLVNVLKNPPLRNSILTRWITGDTKAPTIEDVTTSIQSCMQQVDTIVKELQRSVSGLVSLINSFDTVFKNNHDNFALLQLHVVAGRIIAEKYETETIPAAELNHNPADIFASQDVSYLKDCVDRFGRKVDELETLAHTVKLNAPAIRTLQMASKDKADRIQRIAQTLVPTWKQECTVLLTVLHYTSALNVREIHDDPRFKREMSVLGLIQHSVADFKKVLS